MATAPVTPSSGILTTTDHLFHQAQNGEQFLTGIVAVFLPRLSPWLPGIVKIFNDITAMLDQITGANPANIPPALTPPPTP